jgi:hypothetical protein
MQLSNAYGPPPPSQFQAPPFPTAVREHQWPVAGPPGPAPGLSYDHVQGHATFTAGSPVQGSPYTIPHSNMPSMPLPVEQGVLGPHFDPYAETVRRQQMLAFEQAQNPHRLPAPSPPMSQTTPASDYSAEAVRQDQARAWEKAARSGATNPSHNSPGAASGSGSNPLPSPPGIAASSSPPAADNREAVQRQIQMLQEQVEVLARSQVPHRDTLDPGVPPAYAL